MIQKAFDLIYELCQSVLMKQPYALVLNVVFLVASFVFAYNLIRYLQDHKVFQKILAKLRADIKMQQKLREDEYKLKFEEEGQFQSKSRMQRLSKKLINSGISISYPEITAEMFSLIVLLTCIIVAFALHFFYRDVLTTIIGVIITIFAWMMFLEIMISRNFNALEKETIKFVNLLKNFSHSSTDLGTMLGNTIPYISNPLKKSIEQCYYEIKSNGNTSLALQRLCDRTSYKKLQEVFESLRVCSTHNEEYEQVINESSKSIGDYISYRKEIRAIKRSNVIDILVMGGAGILVIVEMKSMLVDIDVMYYLFGTLLGKITITALILVFAYSIYNAIKDDSK